MALIHTAGILYSTTTIFTLVLASRVSKMNRLETVSLSLTWPLLIVITMLVMLYNITLDIRQHM
jgi:hypothetical protein